MSKLIMSEISTCGSPISLEYEAYTPVGVLDAFAASALFASFSGRLRLYSFFDWMVWGQLVSPCGQGIGKRCGRGMVELERGRGATG